MEFVFSVARRGARFLAVGRAEMATVLVGITIPRLPLRLGGGPACAAEEPGGLWPRLCRPSLCFGAAAAVRRGAVVAADLLEAWWSGLLLSVGDCRWWWLVRGRRNTGCVPGRAGQLLIGSCFAGGNCGSQSHWAMVFLPPLLLCPAASSGSGGGEVRRGAKTLEGSESTKVLSVDLFSSWCSVLFGGQLPPLYPQRMCVVHVLVSVLLSLL